MKGYMIIELVGIGVWGLAFVVFWFYLWKTSKAGEYYISRMTEELIDRFIERTVDRAVRIVEKNYKEDPVKVRLPKPMKSQRKEEAAEGVIQDVMLQNGIDPRLYHLKGLIKNSLLKLGI